jgi:thiol-disulfide isomerase/thioredoxin
MKLPIALLFTCAAFAQPPSGLWDAALDADGRRVAFRLELQGGGTALSGAILDGDRPIRSTSGSFRNNNLALRWEFFDADLTATLDQGTLTGHYARRTRAGLTKRAFSAVPFRPSPPETATGAAQFAGTWRFQTNAARGAKVMDGIFRQSGSEVSGTIQRVDGDFGTLAGRVKGNHLTLSHFDGIRATLLEADLKPDGTLTGLLDGQTQFTAARLEQAARLGIPEPPDPARYVAVKNPAEPLSFRFQDLDGRWVSTSDERFLNKAMIVTIMGSWCPNCHDEAEFLVQLDRRYRAQGLEIVALGFEYTGEPQRDRGLLRAFGQRHSIDYTVLLAGTTEDGEVLRALPQLANFGGYPATLYLGRDHKVVAAHAGFAGPANAEEHNRLKAEIERLVTGMLNNR